MYKNNFLNLKSNKGFTMYDLLIAITILTIFVGIIGSLLVSTYKVQVQTQIDELALLYVIQVAEYIDKINFDEVDSKIANTAKAKFDIPEGFLLNVIVVDYNSSSENVAYVKQVNINIKYKEYNGEEKIISIDRLKVKEI